jgi:hypothetical protein
MALWLGRGAIRVSGSSKQRVAAFEAPGVCSLKGQTELAEVHRIL